MTGQEAAHRRAELVGIIAQLRKIVSAADGASKSVISLCLATSVVSGAGLRPGRYSAFVAIQRKAAELGQCSSPKPEPLDLLRAG